MPPRSHLCPRRVPLLSDTSFFRKASTILLFSASISAQIIDSAPSTTNPSTLSSHPTTSDFSTATSTSATPHSQTTLFSSISAHNATSGNASTSSIDRGSLPLGPAADDPPHPGQHQPTGSGVLNYYFAFLAVFVVILFLAVWYIHRRKKRIKALRASSRQHALSRDLDGWAGGRRWVGGAFRGGLRRQQEDAAHSREEGLNELGEAPPPYKARDSVVVSRDGAATIDSQTALTPDREEPHIAIPLTALSRGGRTATQPPDYREMNQAGRPDVAQPSPAAHRQGFTRANTTGQARPLG